MSAGDAAIDAAEEALRAGQVVAIPTDTVYGLACDPRHPQAVERVYVVKRRPADLELSLLGASLDDLASCGEMGATARRLAAAFWPGGLSLIVPVRPGAGLAVPRRGSSISVRVPDHPGLRALLAMTGVLATTSANRHGEPPATTAEALAAALGPAVELILDAGLCSELASTVVDCTGVEPRLVREGRVAWSEIQAVAVG